MIRARSSIAWHRSIVWCAIASSFATILPSAPTLAQTAQYTPPGPPLDTRTLSCDALKERLQRAGTLDVIGRQGWAETFYARPQCQYWQMPEFEYVTANDGGCGLGYLCQWKPGGR